MDKRQIYLDNASTTPIDPAVLTAMLPYLKEGYGNPSSLYGLGRSSKYAIEQSRQKIAEIIGADREEIVFTGSGTEADNLALFGLARAHKEKGRHIIVSTIEHKAILEPCKRLEKEGFEVTYLAVDKKGLVSLEELRASLRPDTILVSIMYANNEIGTIEPIKKIAQLLKKDGSIYPIFHSDACQAANTQSIDVKELGVDALTLSSSKIYGPKGIGFLYLNKKYAIEPMIVGGGQERGLRSGTENVALIAGMAKALEITEKKKKLEGPRLLQLRDYFLARIKKEIKSVSINGDTKVRLPNNINISIKGVEGEALVLLLDEQGVCCSTGSACSSMDLTPSYVLTSIGVPLELAHCSVRFTLGRHTTKKDTDKTMKILIKAVETLRKISSIKCS